MTEDFPFIDLQAQRHRLGDAIDLALRRVLERGDFIMGKEVAELERRLAGFCGARHAVACGSGTDALLLVLLGLGVGPGDAVFVPALSFVATAETAPRIGATPVFVDVRPDTLDMDAASLEAAIAEARRLGLKPRVVMPVDLYGQPADYAALLAVAERHGLDLVADAAQSFGASLDGVPVGRLARHTAVSFFPAKPLGCFGDGGAVLTDDDGLADSVRSLRLHGKGTHKYDNVRIGMNSRLDTLQAAVLLEKLVIFPDEIVARNRIAARYAQELAGTVELPTLRPGALSVWAQFVAFVPERERIAAELGKRGIPTMIHYPIPLHRQAGYLGFPVAPGGAPEAERRCRNVLSLPMHAYLDDARQDRVVAALREAVSALPAGSAGA
ncbi:MAG: DegT/DnrJ/EryC1/StrS aminotransferase family protein [Magnetospirillum sp. WYHS-4]